MCTPKSAPYLILLGHRHFQAACSGLQPRNGYHFLTDWTLQPLLRQRSIAYVYPPAWLPVPVPDYFLLTDMVGSDTHGTLSVIHVPRHPCLCSIWPAVAVFLFFTSMPLLEGNGVSDIVENMNTACPLFRSPPSHVFLTPLQMYAPTLMRGWCVIFASYHRFPNTIPF
jgi:hypothetical protein